MIDTDFLNRATTGATGWVEKPSRGFPQVKLVRGWEPTDGTQAQVGTGADAAPKKASYVAYHLPPEVAARVRALGSMIPDAELAGDGREERPHVTVKHGLQMDDPEMLRAVLGNVPPGKLRLGDVSVFPAKETGGNFDVVKLDVNSPYMHQLHDHLMQNLPNEETFPEYKPHVTVAYVKPGLGARYHGLDSGMAGVDVPIDHLTFSDPTRTETPISLQQPQTGWSPMQNPANSGADLAGSAKVGTGAAGDEDYSITPYLDPEEERRRLQRRYGWDPGARFAQLGQSWQQNPLVGGVQTAMLPFEALSTGVKYLGGVIQGAEQAIPEAMAGRQIEGENRIVDQGPFGQKVLPRVQNIFNPAEANARYDAIMNPIAQFGVDLLAGGKGLGGVSKAAGWATRGALSAAEDAPVLGRAVQAGQNLLSREWDPVVNSPMTGFLGQVGDVVRSSPVQRGIGAGLPIATAASVYAQDKDEEGSELSPAARATSAALAGLAAFGAGQMLTMGLRTTGIALSKASTGFRDNTVAPPGQPDYLPVERTFWEGISRALRGQSGGVVDEANPPGHPGGYRGLMFDLWRQESTDRLALLQSITSAVERESGVRLPAGDNPATQGRLISGIPDRVKTLFYSEIGDIVKQYKIPDEAIGSGIEGKIGDFDRIRDAQIAFDRQKQFKKQTGPGTASLRDVTDLLETTKGRIDQQYGVGTAEQWLQAWRKITDVHNKVLIDAMDAGLATEAGVAKSIGEHEIWAPLRDQELRPDVAGIQGINLNNRMLPTETGISRWHNTEHATSISLADDLNNIARMQTLTQQQRVVGAMERLRDLSPYFHDHVMPDFDVRMKHLDEEGNPLPLTEQMKAPAGWRQITSFHNTNEDGSPLMQTKLQSRKGPDGRVLRDEEGKPIRDEIQVPALTPMEKTYLLPDHLYDSLMNMTEGQADLITAHMSRMLQPFHLGVTTLSLPFLVKNPGRDVMTATQNLGDTGPLWRNMTGGWFETLTGETGLDDWVRAHPNSPLVGGLANRIEDSLENFFLGSQGRQLENWKGSLGGGGNLVTQSRLRENPLYEAGIPGAQRSGIVGGIERLPRGKVPAAIGATAGGALGGIVAGPPGAAVGALAGGALGALGGVAITGIPDLIMSAALISENATRLGVFRTVREKMLAEGMSPREASQEAALPSRDAVVDFSKGGNTLRLASMWLPLLNARVQGTLTSFDAAKKDPQGFALRAGVAAALPTVMTYASNRLLFNDLYDKISQDEKDKNHILIFGSYTNDRGEQLPLRLKIPKNDVDALISTPIEHFMDTMFHVRNGERALTPDQRTEQSDGQMWLQRLASFLPVNLNSNQDMDPQNLAMAAIGMNPIAGTVSQMWANRDLFRGEQIVPDDKLLLPPQYQFDQRTPQLSRAMSALLHEAGAPQDMQLALAPARTAFMARSLGGTAAQMFLGSGDLLVSALNDGAKAAGYPEITFDPKTNADLGIPAGANPEFWGNQIGALEPQDTRPWYARVAPFVVGSSGGQQTILAKVEGAMSPKDREVWKQTRDLMRQYQEALQVINRRAGDMYDAGARGELSHAEILDRQGKLGAQRREALEALNAQFPLALTDPRQRQAFVDRLPGVPVDARLAQATSDLPSGVDLPSLVERYQHPEAQVDLKGLSPVAIAQVRNMELQRMSQQYNVPISALRDYIAASVAGKSVPALGVPDTWLEKLVLDYRNPRDPATGQPVKLDEISGDHLGDLRRWTVKQAAAESGIPEPDLLQRLQTRLLSPDEQHPVAQSIERAFSVSAQVRDPDLFPQYVDRQGNALGDKNEWGYWDSLIAHAQGVPREKYSRLIRDLVTAKDSANVRRLSFLMQSPDYQDYERWFGTGRSMDPMKWEEFMSGKFPKYRDNPTPQEALRRDGLIQLYQAMPLQAPERRQLTSQVLKYRQLAVKNWRAAIMQEEAAERQQAYGELR